MAARVRMTLTAALGSSSQETASINLHYRTSLGVDLPDSARLQTWANAIAAYLNGVTTTATVLRQTMSSSCVWNRVDLYGYGATGPAQAAGSAAMTWAGTGTINAPFQTSLCLSLRSIIPGASGRGRVYWPALNVTMAATGKRNITGNVASEFAALNAGIETAGGDLAPELVVYSPTKDLLTTVSTVLAGDTYDTQRRRRDAIVEQYQSAAI